MYILHIYFDQDRPNKVDDDLSFEELMATVDEDAAVFWDRDMGHLGIDWQTASDMHLQVGYEDILGTRTPSNDLPTMWWCGKGDMVWRNQYGGCHARWIDAPWFKGWVPIHIASETDKMIDGSSYYKSTYWPITGEWFLLKSWSYRV